MWQRGFFADSSCSTQPFSRFTIHLRSPLSSPPHPYPVGSQDRGQDASQQTYPTTHQPQALTWRRGRGGRRGEPTGTAPFGRTERGKDPAHHQVPRPAHATKAKRMLLFAVILESSCFYWDSVRVCIISNSLIRSRSPREPKPVDTKLCSLVTYNDQESSSAGYVGMSGQRSFISTSYKLSVFCWKL